MWHKNVWYTTFAVHITKFSHKDTLRQQGSLLIVQRDDYLLIVKGKWVLVKVFILVILCWGGWGGGEGWVFPLQHKSGACKQITLVSATRRDLLAMRDQQTLLKIIFVYSLCKFHYSMQCFVLLFLLIFSFCSQTLHISFIALSSFASFSEYTSLIFLWLPW